MKNKLLAFFMMLSAYSYGQRQLQGRVVDENDQPLPGASILIKGSTIGTVTDVEGVYKLTDVPADAVVIATYIGYITQESPLAGKTRMDFKLLLDAKSLDEIVVIGYGTAKVKELTGAVSVVNGATLTALNPVRLETALQGQMAGVQIASTSGSPGGALNIRIRGFSTNGNNNPLILVDGIPYSAEGLSSLNPSDIESMNVLKDGTAAIYGVRAGNGVIIITTKQGKRNSKPTIEFTGYYGTQSTIKKIDLLNAQEYAVLKNEAYAAGGQTPPFVNTDLGTGTNWQDHVFQKAPIQNYNLNISGGADKSSYSLGGSFVDQEGIIGGKKSAYRRYNARLNFTTDLASKVKLQHVLLFTQENRKTLPENTIGSVLYNTINASPLASVKDENGKYTYLQEFSDIVNPLALIENTHNEALTYKFTGKEEISYKVNNLEFTGRAGYNYALVNEKSFLPLVYYGSGKAQNTASNEALDPFILSVNGAPYTQRNSVTESRTSFLDYNFEAYLNYNKVLAEHHSLKATLGTALLGNQSENLTGVGRNIPYNSVDFADISLADPNDIQTKTTSWQTWNRLLSYFVRAEYGYDSKYLLSAILRRDASTRFGKNNRFGYFPALSGAWVISEEPFFNKGIIQFAKLRGSYGVSGNDKIQQDFQYRALLGGEAVYPFNDQLVNGIAIGVPGNPDLKWETTGQTNFGLDLNMFNDHVNITTDYYIKKTKDLIFQPDISGISGAYGAGGSAPYVNGGDVKNSGFEFLIGYNTTIGNDLKIDMSYNLTTIHNETTGLQQGVDFYSYGSFGVGGGSATRMEVGYPMGFFYGYKTEGVYQNASEVSDRGITQNGAQPGDLKYADLDGNLDVNFSNNSDKTIIGSPIPSAIMGLNLRFDFKGIDFSTMFYASVGNEILRNYERQQPLANQLSYKVGRWTGEGSTNENPRLTTALNTNNVMSDYFIEDGSFIRLKNIQLGYSLPTTLIQKIGAKKLRVYVAANNLITLTKYRGFDPDFASASPLLSGIDYGFYPQAKTVMAGLNLTF